MDNESIVNSKHTDELDHDNSLQVDMGGMYTERKLGLINETEGELHIHEYSAH